MKYFKFKYIENKDGKIVSQGDALYYTSAEQNLDGMKNFARNILKKSRGCYQFTIDYRNRLRHFCAERWKSKCLLKSTTANIALAQLQGNGIGISSCISVGHFYYQDVIT